MLEKVEEMDLEHKDVFVLLGPTRTGKGTLLTAFGRGTEMKLFQKKHWQQFAAEQKVYAANFMAPVDAKGHP